MLNEFLWFSKWFEFCLRVNIIERIHRYLHTDSGAYEMNKKAEVIMNLTVDARRE